MLLLFIYIVNKSNEELLNIIVAELQSNKYACVFIYIQVYLSSFYFMINFYSLMVNNCLYA